MADLASPTQHFCARACFFPATTAAAATAAAATAAAAAAATAAANAAAAFDPRGATPPTIHSYGFQLRML
jgi:hypothetical protein